jgi:hypothetical protein
MTNPPEYKGHQEAILELYIQTQDWARHNENLISVTNVLILGGIGALSVDYFKEAKSSLIIIAGITALIGTSLAIILNSRYIASIRRLVVYESYFGFHQYDKGIQEAANSYAPEWGISLVPSEFHAVPKFSPVASLFLAMYSGVLIACIYLTLTGSHACIPCPTSK